mmetsp:Transcript_89016/g.223983  ORF Transcript_89016/g.223983 Transcript_89016/m.223983 type:complete len:221 (-) Transcript_89016:357-1019(-)
MDSRKKSVARRRSASNSAFMCCTCSMSSSSRSPLSAALSNAVWRSAMSPVSSDARNSNSETFKASKCRCASCSIGRNIPWTDSMAASRTGTRAASIAARIPWCALSRVPRRSTAACNISGGRRASYPSRSASFSSSMPLAVSSWCFTEESFSSKSSIGSRSGSPTSFARAKAVPSRIGSRNLSASQSSSRADVKHSSRAVASFKGLSSLNSIPTASFKTH